MKVRELARYAMFLALGIIVGYIEFLIPLNFLPGIKLGLANAIGILVLHYQGKVSFITYGFLRVFLSSLLFGTFLGTGFFISLGGMILSTIITLLLFSFSKCSVYGISVSSAIMHGIGQIIVVIIIYGTPKLLSYLLILSINGCITGILIAFLASLIIKRLKVS